MSELAQLTGATPSVDDVLPGYILSKWSITDIGAAEQEFQQDHIRTVAAASSGSPPDVQAQMSETAQNCVVWGYFLYGAPGFWAKTAAAYLLPFVLWLSLRGKQSQMTRQAAATLVTDENRKALQEACRRCAGWKPAPNSKGATGTTTDAPPSDAPQSPGDSSTAPSPAAG